MSRLLLVRHGDTELNSRERFWGCTDVRLSAEGISQAEKLRDRLATEKIDLIYASDLERAWRTAEIIAHTHQKKVITCPEIRETDFGKIEGLSFNEVTHLYPDLTESWLSWDIQMRFPDGEGVSEVDSRVRKFKEQLKKHNLDETILVVAHAGTLRMLICQMLGLEIHHWRQLRVGLASLSIVETFQGADVLTLLNDVSHLKCDSR
jgi:alpha-ribazole phosphatase